MMGATEDYARTRALRRRKSAPPVKKKEIKLWVACPNVGQCSYRRTYIYPDGAEYPQTMKCPECGTEIAVSRMG